MAEDQGDFQFLDTCSDLMPDEAFIWCQMRPTLDGESPSNSRGPQGFARRGAPFPRGALCLGAGG
eukprot:3399592-Pyramimonas_sp.AAC.1